MYDLSKCLIDFTKCPADVKLVDHFTELSAFEEFQNCFDDNHIRIAIATADPQSPFVRIKDRELMLNSLFDFLKIPLAYQKDKQFYDEVLIHENNAVLACISAYLRFLHDLDWTEYQTTKQTYDVLVAESHRKRSNGEDLDDYVTRRVKIQGHLKKIGADLKILEAKIFPDSHIARKINMEEQKKIITYAEKYSEENSYL